MLYSAARWSDGAILAQAPINTQPVGLLAPGESRVYRGLRLDLTAPIPAGTPFTPVFGQRNAVATTVNNFAFYGDVYAIPC